MADVRKAALAPWPLTSATKYPEDFGIHRYDIVKVSACTFERLVVDGKPGCGANLPASSGWLAGQCAILRAVSCCSRTMARLFSLIRRWMRNSCQQLFAVQRVWKYSPRRRFSNLLLCSVAAVEDRKKNDRDISRRGFRLQPGAGFKAVLAGHHDVEKNEVGLFLPADGEEQKVRRLRNRLWKPSARRICSMRATFKGNRLTIRIFGVMSHAFAITSSGRKRR